MYDYSGILYRNSFTKALLKKNIEINKKFLHKNISFIENHEYYTSTEKYYLKLGVHVFKILYIFDQLKQIKIYLQKLKDWDMNNIYTVPNYEYIKYHLENFNLRMFIILDITYLLLNCLFKIGKTNKECNYKSIILNSNVSDTPIKQLIDQYKAKIDSQKILRNNFIHEGYSYDKEIYYYGLIECLKYTPKDENIRKLYNEEFNFIKEHEESKVIKKLDKWIKIIESYINNLLNNCYNYYQ